LQRQTASHRHQVPPPLMMMIRDHEAYRSSINSRFVVEASTANVLKKLMKRTNKTSIHFFFFFFVLPPWEISFGRLQSCCNERMFRNEFPLSD